MRVARWLAPPAPGALAALAALALVVAGSARANADPGADKKADKKADKDADKEQKAEQLFAEGKALMASNLIQACGKFKSSLDYNPAALGTLMNLALCQEKLGLVASAFERFSQARELAKEQDLREHLRAAEDHIALLGPDVPHLALTLTEPLPGTQILVDDKVVPPSLRDQYPVDPGERVVVVSAPARLPYRIQVVIARAERKTLVIPALARSVTVTSSRRRIGQITTVGGAVVLGTGIGFGLYARHLYHKELDNHDCVRTGGQVTCSPVGKSTTDNARNWGVGGTVVGVTGIAIAAVGAYLWYSAPSSTRSEPDDKKLTVVPAVTGTSLGMVALGRF